MNEGTSVKPLFDSNTIANKYKKNIFPMTLPCPNEASI